MFFGWMCVVDQFLCLVKLVFGWLSWVICLWICVVKIFVSWLVLMLSLVVSRGFILVGQFSYVLCCVWNFLKRIVLVVVSCISDFDFFLYLSCCSSVRQFFFFWSVDVQLSSFILLIICSVVLVSDLLFCIFGVCFFVVNCEL